MAKRVLGRPELLGTHNATLLAIPARVLRSEDTATVDAQRQTQMGAARTNEAIDSVNQLLQPPFGSGQLLTQPDGSGGREELLTVAAGDNDFRHTLGHPVNGFVVCDLQGRGDVELYRKPVSRSFDEQYIRIHAAHACSAKIWVW